MSRKLNTSLFAIKQIKAISDSGTARTAYFALFESHMRYGLAVWGGTSASNIQRILRLQKRAIRTLAGLPFLASCREAFKNLRIQTVVALYIQEVVMYVNGQDLVRNKSLHQHNTRNAETYALPIHHLTQYEKQPAYMGRKLHNCLPPDLQSKGERN